MTTPEAPAPDQPSAASDAQDTPIPESSSTSPAMAAEAQPDPESEAISPETPPPSTGDIEPPIDADLPAGAGSPTEGSPRSRRFGPRRSRSAPLVAEAAAPVTEAPIPAVPSAEKRPGLSPDADRADNAVLERAETDNQPNLETTPAETWRDRAARWSPEPPEAAEGDTPPTPEAAATGLAEAASALAGAARAAVRAGRVRGRRQATSPRQTTGEASTQTAATAGQADTVSSEGLATEAEAKAPPQARRRIRSRQSKTDDNAVASLALESSPDGLASAPANPGAEAEAVADLSQTATRSRRSRRRVPPSAATEVAPLTPASTPSAAVGPAPGPGEDGVASRGVEGPYADPQPRNMVPKQDDDGTDALAQALLDMFPASLDEGTQIEDPLAEGETDRELVISQSRALAEDETTADMDQGPRRSRRGRRGGRGRRKGAAHMAGEDTPAGSESDTAEDTAVEAPVALPTLPLKAAPVPALSLFTPETGDRQVRSWRDRPPQRRWGRTFPQETHTVTMPPPKPSHGARFAPIPQALPPAPAVQPLQPTVPVAMSYVMPDLRVNEPLGPGETRTERLLDLQTRLLQAMLEGQARQIESLSANVASLYQTVRDLAADGGLRGTQPRTAIFVDAPNVCYAAENARVSLDFSRMLKYLARDRQLVHALSYSPIIDDVREGIRYETQRFVAPFLRTGYKLITKPLKRFSDGSAKGNFDLELALDILTMADRLDVVVLVSGDSDFECVIEYIQSRGVRVEVVAFASNVSTELVNIADTFIDIMQHIEHFKAI